MKKFKILILSTLIASLFIGCTTSGEPAVVEGDAIDYTNTTVFELLELSDKIEFIGKDEASDILVNAENILTRLSKNDAILLYGDNNDRTYENSMKFFFSSLLEWDTDFLAVADQSTDDRSEYEKEEAEKLNQVIGGNIAEKDRIISIVLEIEDYFTNNNIDMPSDIKIAKYVDLFEYEKAFSVDNVIFLSENLLTSHKETIKEEIIRQLFFVYLNTNPDQEERLFSKIGFSKNVELIVDETIVKDKYTNPNAPKLNYSFNGQYAGSNISFIPVSNVKKIDAEEVKYEINSKYYSVDISQEKTKFSMYDKSYKRDEKGSPIVVELSELTNFEKYFLSKSGDFKHPRIIASDYFVNMVNERESKDARIEQYFEEIIKN